MNVALTHLNHAWSGGTERYLNHLAAFLAEEGHGVTIVCRRHQSPPNPAVRFVRLRSPALGPAHRLWRFARDVERHLRAARYDVVMGLGRTWSQDVLRLGGGCHATYLEAMAAATGRRRPRVASLKDRVIQRIERRALGPHTTARLVCNARMVRDDLVRRHGVDPARVEIIYNGVDLQRFHPRNREDAGARLRAACRLDPSRFVLLFLGTGYRRKGLDLVLRALPDLARDEDRVHLLVAGNDSHPAPFRSLARELGVDDRVTFLGARADPEACYGAADLYVLPTRYDPFANTTLEALASGLPVVTTRQNGGSELLAEGEHGALVDPSPADVLAALRQWTGRERAHRGGQAARKLAEAHAIDGKMRDTLAVLERAAREKALRQLA